MKNLFEHTNAFWAKYAAYEWRVAADGNAYLDSRSFWLQYQS